MLIDILINGTQKKTHPTQKTPQDRWSRSVVKAISWRLLGTLDTIMIALLITGEISQALSIGLIEWLTKIILYFFHERLWNRIRWGRDVNSEI
ncbi:MAG: DUF2061 domain-containing protein [Flavobacteriaceae bacterium]